MAKILVTGGAGFVGSHLCEQLLREGNEVIALDDFSTGNSDNVLHLAAYKAFTLVEHDVTEPYDFDVELIYNLACPASPPHYQADPVKTTLISVLGAVHALSLGKRRRARVLQASTSEVYGDPLVHPQPESYAGCVNTLGPRACYDEGKRCAESLVMDFHRMYQVETRIVRIFNTYGPRMAFDDGRVVSNFILQALTGDELTIYGDGTQTRSFCFVADLVGGLIRLMQHPTETRPVNLGNPEEFTMRQLAHEVLTLTRSSSRVVERPLPVDDPKQRRPDIRRAREVLGFRPRVALREGLLRTIEDFRERLRLPADVRTASAGGG
ncbi:MAG: NAD-dependent dehydratase [Myxococcales bacterium]|nr:NAD-dependent dehydratase [Myxococcales bacterium]